MSIHHKILSTFLYVQKFSKYNARKYVELKRMKTIAQDRRRGK